MYIRRKVYSVYTDEETGEEKLFCEDQIMSEEEYLEKLYSTGKIANFIRKGKRNLKVGLDEMTAGFKMAAGKDLSPKDVKAIARSQSLAVKKGKPVYTSSMEKLSPSEVVESKNVWREKARKGKGASNLFGSLYI